jgi:hypothetical protein
MVAVFVGFALDPDVTVKTTGVGMAAAVLIDATVVRMVLVPATMALLGRANWWLPRWLDSAYGRASGTAGSAAREPASSLVTPAAPRPAFLSPDTGAAEPRPGR